MKNISKKTDNLNLLSEARKTKGFISSLKESELAIRLAVVVYEKRKEKGWNQTHLAKEMKTTQKVISNIESGEVDVRSSTIGRLVEILHITSDELADIYQANFKFSTENMVTGINLEELSISCNKNKVSTLINY